MDMSLKQKFAERWAKYFPGAELPITFFYTDDETSAEAAPDVVEWQCLLGNLSLVRRGKSRRFGIKSIGCPGGQRCTGMTQQIRPNFEYFLSWGIPGQLEGERYRKSPEIAAELMRMMPTLKAPAEYIVFKRWDDLDERDNPEVVIFFATPDVLAGLCTLSGFDEPQPETIMAPFSSGCGSIIIYPYLEKDKPRPKSVIGMFDISSRTYVQENLLSFATPMSKFKRMVDNMDESFLIGKPWERVQRRIKQRVP